MTTNRLDVLLKYFAPIVFGSFIAANAWAFENLLGDYEGKIKNLAGYSGQANDACRVTVARSDLYGGAVSFEIHGAEKLLVEESRVAKDYQPGIPEISWVTPGSSPRQPGEVVSATFRDNGSMKSLKLLIKHSALHQVKHILCGELKRLP